MVNISKADYLKLVNRPLLAREVAKVGKVRKTAVRRGYAEWLASMEKGPGIFVALHTHTPGNTRRHWTIDSKEAARQREAVAMALLAARSTLPAFPVAVAFTRHGGKMDPHNLQGTLKHVIDEVAKFYGVDDGDPRWRFRFEQERSKFHGVGIEIMPGDGAAGPGPSSAAAS